MITEQEFNNLQKGDILKGDTEWNEHYRYSFIKKIPNNAPYTDEVKVNLITTGIEKDSYLNTRFFQKTFVMQRFILEKEMKDEQNKRGTKDI